MGSIFERDAMRCVVSRCENRDLFSLHLIVIVINSYYDQNFIKHKMSVRSEEIPFRVHNLFYALIYLRLT